MESMEKKTIWTEEVLVKSFETDTRSRWRPSCFFQAMQEAATHHAAHLGFQYLDMLAQNRIWILSRMKIQFVDFPGLGEAVCIRTWPKGIQQKLFFMRDFEITGAGGRNLARATSAWILIDPSARRMLLPQSLPGKVPDNGGLAALDEPLERIHLPAGMEERLQATASYSAIDLMGHVNNARYIEWIADSFQYAEFAERTLAWLQINYINEVRPGEMVAVAAAPAPDSQDSWALQGVNRGTGAISFEAALAWKF